MTLRFKFRPGEREKSTVRELKITGNQGWVLLVCADSGINLGARRGVNTGIL